MTDAKRDTNYVTTLVAISSVDGVSIVPLRADPVTGRLLTSSSGAGITVGTTTITGGTTTRILYDNAGVLGEYTISGSGTVVAMATSPSFTTPSLGVATATSINGNTFTTGTYTLTGQAGKTLTFNGSITLTGTDAQTYTFPSTSATIARTDAANTFTGTQTVTTIAGLTTVTGAASNMTITAGTGNSRTMILQTTTSGGTATTALTLNADQTATFAAGITAAGATTIGTGNAFTCGTIELGAASDTTIARSGAGAITVEGVQVILSGAALGTPSSGTLTNCTGLPIAGLTASTSTALGVGSIELGHATDTTIARVSSGVVSIEGVNIMTVGAAQVVTGQNKFNNIIDVTNNITASSNAATVPVTFRLSTVTNSSAATLTITMTTTSAVDGQMTIVRIYDFSGVAQTITWVNTENSTVSAPTTSNGSTTLPLTVGFMYNTATSNWRCIASA